jgi:hypothetical protein
MSLRATIFGLQGLGGSRGVSLRMGLWIGACLSIIVAVWLVVANRVPGLERFAAERNMTAAVALAALALVPVVRFLREPGRLLISGLLAWTLLSLTYRLASLFFSALGARLGAFHVFILGAVAYTIAATVAWIATLVWSVRNHHAAGSHQHLS